MATGTNIRTYFNGVWHDGNIPIMSAADHGTWLGSTVFDGARYACELAPDLMAHVARLNRSARALLLEPTHSDQEIFDITWQGLQHYSRDAAVYIRPMYWGINTGHMTIVPDSTSVGFAICLEDVPMPDPEKTLRLTTTQFRRPVLESSVTNAKAGCLYPNNARMLAEAQAKGYDNVLAADALGNVAESATANVFIVKDGVISTPVPNGTFLAGITRARHISNLRGAGFDVRETTLSFEDIHAADEVFLSGNFSKVTGVSEFDGTLFDTGPVTQKTYELYWAWARASA